MKVGDKIWLFDTNRRVYEKNYTMSSAPIFSEHFYQVEITGETSRSWIIDMQRYSKNTQPGIYTDKQKEDAIWEHENRYELVDLVRYCSIDKLRILLKLMIRRRNKMTVKDLQPGDFEKRIKITSAKNKLLIGKMGTLTNSFAGERNKAGLFLDIPFKNGQDEVNLTKGIVFEFTNLLY